MKSRLRSQTERATSGKKTGESTKERTQQVHDARKIQDLYAAW